MKFPFNYFYRPRNTVYWASNSMLTHLLSMGPICLRIWHFAGCSHLHPQCRPLWLAAYQECFDANVAGIKKWAPITQVPPSLCDD